MLRFLIAVGLLLAIWNQSALAGVRKEIRVQQGASTSLEGVVSQSDHDRYLLQTSPSQTLQIKLESTTSNGVFSVFGPGYTEESNGFVSGRSLQQEVTSARVAPATSGTHLIDVGSLGGTTRYRMIVTVEGGGSDSRQPTPAKRTNLPEQTDTRLQLENAGAPRLLVDTWLRCGEGRSHDLTRVFLSDGTFIQTEFGGAPNPPKIETVGDYLVSEQTATRAKVTFPRDVLTSTEKKLEKMVWRHEKVASSASNAKRIYWYVGDEKKPFLACDYGDKLSATELAEIKSTIRGVTSRKHLAASAQSVDDFAECRASTAREAAITRSTELVALRLRARKMNCVQAETSNGVFAEGSSLFENGQREKNSDVRANYFLLACSLFKNGVNWLRSGCKLQ
jgi:hypothetical protein